LIARRRAVERRQPGEAGEAQPLAPRIDAEHVLGEIAAEDRGEPRAPAILRFARREIAGDGVEAAQHAVFVADHREGDAGIGHGEALDHVDRLVALGARRLHEFEPRRRRVEEIAYFDTRALRMRRRFRHALGAAFDAERPRAIAAARTARQREPAHRADRRQRFAAEAQRADAQEIVIRQFRGTMPLDRERQLLARHAVAVIAHDDQALPAIAQHHLDARGAGIDGVLNQFLDGGCRALDHFAGGDAIDEDWRQLTDGHDGYCASPRPRAPSAEATRECVSAGARYLISPRYCRASTLPSSTAGWSKAFTLRRAAAMIVSSMKCMSSAPRLRSSRRGTPMIRVGRPLRIRVAAVARCSASSRSPMRLPWR